MTSRTTGGQSPRYPIRGTKVKEEYNSLFSKEGEVQTGTLAVIANDCKECGDPDSSWIYPFYPCGA